MDKRKRRTQPPHRSDRRESDRRPATGGGAAWLFGLHAVRAALANPERRLHRLLLTAEAAAALGMPLPAGRPAPERVERAALDTLLPGAVHQGAAILAEPLEPLRPEDVARLGANRADAVVVVLDQVTDPHNVGAILRSAAAFGAGAVMVQDRNAPPETGTLAKAASGALELVPLARAVNLARALDALKEAGFWIVGLEAGAPQSLTAANLSGRIALVLGAEGQGMRRLVRERCDTLVRLPMSGAVDSLNVSNAAAVALYEIVRSRSG